MKQKIIKTIGKTLNATSLLAPKFASKKALKLFATPRKGKYNKTTRKVIDQAVTETLIFNTIRIKTYLWQGRNKTILLAHGWESNAARWHYLLEDFKTEDYNIIALDAPSHGDTNGKTFNALLYADCINVVAQRFKPSVLIGHSVGGMASVFALHYNTIPTVKKIILLGAPAHFIGVFYRYKKMMGYNTNISLGLDKIILERYNKPVDYFSAANFTAEFKDIEGLIIHDEKDPIIPYQDALLFKFKFKNSKLLTTSSFGHGLKDPSITQSIIKFINS